MVSLMAAPALAQNTGEATGEVTVTHASVSLDDCKRLVKYVPSADVAYKPGVDVHGKAVKPADDKPLGAIEVPQEIIIDFGIDLAGRYGFGAAGLFDATAGIATIKYDVGTGALMVNGKPLLDTDSQAIEAACTLRLQQDADK
ncbi:hypothetical protein BEN30_07085 [Magnetovibrio blakemorei]|uniref:Uncharacterized protein n=2 Tax=Magnetovibrio blakemorei TaxID=28181 RepID=A0A1E5Q955_9PROT|nr:hypothetical protein BEN30_07085 [Magnetovibrio blakemorei]